MDPEEADGGTHPGLGGTRPGVCAVLSTVLPEGVEMFYHMCCQQR